MTPSFRVPADLPVPPGQGDAPLPDSPLLVQLAISRAADLARAGHHEEAARLLSGLRLTPRQAVPVFHLGARIHAQVGQFEEAADLWKRLLQVEPGHAGARDGLRLVQRLRARPLWLATLLSWPVALAVLAGAACWMLARPPAAPAGVEVLLAEQRRLAAEVERLRGALDGLPAAPEIEAGDLPVTLETKGAERVLRFKEPLFEGGGAELRAEAKTLLGRLAEKLAGKARVLVVAYAIAPLDAAQARKRAAAVAERLGGEILDRPGGEAPSPGEALVLRLTRVKP